MGGLRTKLNLHMSPRDGDAESYLSGSLNSGSLDSDLRVQDLPADSEISSTEKLSDKYNIYDPAIRRINNEDETIEPRQNIWRKLLILLRPSFVLDHLDYSSVKTAIQTFLTCWPTVFFLVVSVIVHWIGAAAFLMQIVGFLTPVGGRPLIHNLYDTFMCSLYALVAWLFIVICQVITNRLRGSITREQLAQLLIEDGTCTAENISECLSTQVYTGRFLQTKSTVIYVIAFMIYYSFAGLISTRNPVLFKTPFICGSIMMVILMCYNNFWPTFEGLLINQIVVKPMMLQLAYKLVCSLVLLPDTASYHYFRGSASVCREINKMMNCNINFFMTMKPSNDYFLDFKHFHRDAVKIRDHAAKLELTAAFTKYEVSYGRLSAGVVGEMRSMTKHLLTISSGYEYFYQLVDERRNFAMGKILSLNKNRTRTRTSSMGDDSNLKLFGAIKEAYRPVGNYENNLRTTLIKQRLEKVPNAITLSQLDLLCDLLKDFYYPYMKANSDAVECIAEWLEAANGYRLSSILPGASQKHDEKQNKMKNRIIEFRQIIVANIDELQSYEKFAYFRGKTSNEELTMTLISLTSLVTFFTVHQTKSVLKILDELAYLDEKHPRPKFYTYFTNTLHERARNLFLLYNSEEHHEGLPGFIRNQSISQRNPDSLPPSSVYQVIGRIFVKFYFILLNENFLFWVRGSAFVICCAIPYFARTTANWYFRNRCVWVVIVCAFGISEYSGETIYVFFTKLIYSLFGCIIGCVGWYVSTGKGHGNPYGFAVVTAVIAFFLSFHRHFANHSTLIPQILMSLTSALVLGTSWTDRFADGANAGFGIEVAYKRFLMVVVGLAVGFFASILPRPKSSKVAFRRIISNVIGEAGNLHCDLVAFALQRIDNPQIHISPRHDPIVNRFRVILMKLAGTASLMVPIKNEVPIVGDWPSKKYEALLYAVNDFIQLYSILHQVFNLIEEPATNIPKLIKTSGWDNAEINADLFSVLHMTSDALLTSAALPKITAGTISLKHLDHVKELWGIQRTSPSETVISEELHKRALDNDLHESMNRNLDHEKLFTKDGNLNLVGVILCHFIYKRIDEILMLVKSLVGEKYDLNDTVFGELGKMKEA